MRIFPNGQAQQSCFLRLRRKTTLTLVRNPCRHQTRYAALMASTLIVQLQHKIYWASEPVTKSRRSHFLITEPVFHGQATTVLSMSQMTATTPNMVTCSFFRTEEIRGRATTYFKLIHHFADPSSLLANDITVKIKGNLHLNGDRNKSLQRVEHSLPAEIFLLSFRLPYTCPKERVAALSYIPL